MSRKTGSWVNILSPACLVVGLSLLVASFLWSRIDSGSTTWTNDDAVALQQAASKAHELSFSVTGSSSASEKQALKDARDAHDRLNGRRQAAIDGAEWRKLLVRWIGAGVAVVGVALAWRARNEPESSP